ncbi:hypothetical protein [Shewanella ulleungensis]|uniref:hypothetical protein n=1 Tax=Shewanella ulleungensis TaxID=2282699 RepID=UPI003D7994F8
MFNKKVSRLIMLSAVGAVLLGCGSDSSDSSSSDVAYVQYYNASPNSTSTSLVLDDYAYTAIDFADAMPRYGYSVGSTDLEIYGQDEDGETVTIYSDTVSLKDDDNHLFVLYGDYLDPQLLDINYNRDDMDELNADDDYEYSKMQVLVANVATDEGTFDAYISLDTQSIDEAVMIGSAAYSTYTDSTILDTDDYIVYLTTTGTKDVVYTTGSMDLTTETVYKLVIRNSFGAGDIKVTIDSVDSTTTPDNYAALEATADYRVFNGLETQSIDIDVVSKQETQYLYDVASFAVTDYQSTSFNDYGITVRDATSKTKLFDNLLVTFNQDDVKSLLIYQKADSSVKGMVISQDLRPRAYEYKVDVVNLSYDYDDLTVYFVRDSETIETAEYTLTDLDFVEQQSLTLPSDDYEINIVYEDDNGTQTLVYQSESMSISGSNNFTFVLTPDTESALGHRLTSLE